VPDRVWIFGGLALFVAAVTTPFWYARANTTATQRRPDLVLPANAKECVAPAGTMRADHMQLLLNWREDVVRRGDRRYVAFNGKVYDKSLTGTCLGCHSKHQFCDRCHEYSGVSGPYCWNCHADPQTATARAMP
jgi:[DsrC]-trisulfide reductase subunit J